MRAKIIDGSKPRTVNSRYYIGNTRDKASGEFGRKSLEGWPGMTRRQKVTGALTFVCSLSVLLRRIRQNRYAFAMIGVATESPENLAADAGLWRS